MRHFAHHIGDYAAATAHLSFVEDAAYHRCLRRYYQDEKPLPADQGEVCRLVGARSPAEKTAVQTVLREFFELWDDGWHQRRADKEIEAYRAKADTARENGTKGGRPPNRKKTDPVSPSVQSGKLTKNHEPLTKNHLEADAAFAVWQDTGKHVGWPDAQFMTSTRRFKFDAILAICGGLEGWKGAMAQALEAGFLRTSEGRWQPWFNLDWLLDQDHFTRLMEGRYAERHATSSDARSLTAGLAGFAEAGSR